MAGRGRPRKIKLSNEIQDKIDEVILVSQQNEDKEYHQIIEQVKQKYKKPFQWDVKKGDKIEFFDSNLSYELSGYRPIDKTHGLDFKPEWFTEARDNYNKNGKYCSYTFGSKLYRDFWDLQYERCRKGLTVNGYTITGDQYYFLNFYRLKDLTKTTKAGEGRIESFPNFFVAQYIYFHYIELCRLVRKNAVGLKARGVGFSEIGASIVSTTYQVRPDSRCIIASYADIYLKDTLDKCWEQLNFCNNNTEGGFFKLRQAHNTDIWKRASFLNKIKGQENESGWMSEIVGITADKPSKIRGGRTDLLLYEESGSWPNWKKAFLQGDALVGIQGNRFGIKIGWGTGGDSGPALAGLADAYTRPSVYDVLPYKHNYTPDGSTILSGFFIPAYSIVNTKECIDNRGYTDPEKGKAYYDKIRDGKLKDPQAYVIYCAEYCYNADEALALEGTNKFNKVLITNQIAKIKLYNEGPKIENGDLQFTYNKGNERTSKNVSGVKWISGKDGLIHIIEKPLWELQTKDEEGKSISYKEMKNLYVAGIDSIDIGQDQTSDYTKDPSKFCIVIKKRAFGMQEPMYVAYYMFRPRDERQAYETAIKLMMYYNCRCNIEATRLTMLSWAKSRGWGDYFMTRPKATYPDIKHKQSNTIGTPATETIITHQTDLIAQYVEDYCQNIWFPEMLDQLNKYTNENKTHFDIIAALGMVELADEELSGIIPREVEEVSNQWEDIGYYTDEKGYKRWGVIPKKQTYKTMFNWDDHPTNLIHSSDPRKNI